MERSMLASWSESRVRAGISIQTDCAGINVQSDFASINVQTDCAVINVQTDCAWMQEDKHQKHK